MDATSLPFPPNDLMKTALKTGEKVLDEYHLAGSRVGVIDCQTQSSDKGEVKCSIEDHSSGLHIAVRMLVLSGA